MLSSKREVVRALITYTDWWHPLGASIIQVVPARRQSGPSDGIPPGLLENLDERTELRFRMQLIKEPDRHVLFLWFVKQLPVSDIAREMRISRRQCFRRKARAL